MWYFLDFFSLRKYFHSIVVSLVFSAIISLNVYEKKSFERQSIHTEVVKVTVVLHLNNSLHAAPFQLMCERSAHRDLTASQAQVL